MQNDARRPHQHRCDECGFLSFASSGPCRRCGAATRILSDAEVDAYARHGHGAFADMREVLDEKGRLVRYEMIR